MISEHMSINQSFVIEQSLKPEDKHSPAKSLIFPIPKKSTRPEAKVDMQFHPSLNKLHLRNNSVRHKAETQISST